MKDSEEKRGDIPRGNNKKKEREQKEWKKEGRWERMKEMVGEGRRGEEENEKGNGEEREMKKR